MANYRDSNSDYDVDQKLMYDLRMTWAWTMHRADQMIMMYKIQNDYYSWYNMMVKMWPKVLGRVKKKYKQTKEDFETLKKETKDVLTKYESVYLRKKITNEGVEMITDALNRLELFIERVKERNNMYGTAIAESVY